MMKILEDLAYNPAKLAAFQEDPEAFVDLYGELTEYEKYLLVERNAAAIEGYLKNGLGQVGRPVYAAPVVVAAQLIMVLVALATPHDPEEPVVASAIRFDAYWRRITDRAQALAG